MFAALLTAAVLTSQAPGVDVWELDAARTFTVSKAAPESGGVDTTVQSIPSPFSVSTARILRQDGTAIRVSDGLRDVGMSAELDAIVKAERREWLRVAVTQVLVAGGGAVVGALGVLVVTPGVFLAWNAWRMQGGQPILQPSVVLSTPGMLVGSLIAVAGAAFLIPGALVGIYASNRALRATKNAVVTGPKTLSSGVDWPVDMAAKVVRAHNERVAREMPPQQDIPEEQLPPAPQEMPTIIPA